MILSSSVSRGLVKINQVITKNYLPDISQTKALLENAGLGDLFESAIQGKSEKGVKRVLRQTQRLINKFSVIDPEKVAQFEKDPLNRKNNLEIIKNMCTEITNLTKNETIKLLDLVSKERNSKGGLFYFDERKMPKYKNNDVEYTKNGFKNLSYSWVDKVYQKGFKGLVEFLNLSKSFDQVQQFLAKKSK